ncbi:flagellar biosynthesis protein FliQ [Paratissierella segnis]|jgi:flagellar biosynthetic protein FliQ|uniref:Flagellar biosynthetic protein FliQ n=1 Tax=Paratissierella segnis TaxID=2763679 RepID=A0A926EY30_9FIRM|nr:flagellar biosynthesis protein FliQ [Paratissierella segnis]MBC8588340.1 flagellar biosynthesis protein FliQ [Paratissierella segnis]
MTQVLVLDILRNAYITIMKVSGPVLLISLVVGLIISILQATTQVQEQTLSFVPKIIAVMISLIVFGNFMLNGLISFTTYLFRIISNLS